MTSTIESYVTPAEADTYISQFVFDSSAWVELTTEEKQVLLNNATSLINKLPLNNVKADCTQLNAFPRTSGGLQEAQEACCEIAMSLSLGVNVEFEANTAFVESDTFQSVKVAYRSNVMQLHKMYNIPSYRAWTILLPFIDLTRSIGLERV